MARVTVEDCVESVPNRFELVVLAAQRAKNIGSGAPITVERDNDKNAVIALREIANGTIDPDALRDEVISGMQRVHFEPDLGEEAIEEEAIEATKEISEEIESLRQTDENAEEQYFSEHDLDVDD